MTVVSRSAADGAVGGADGPGAGQDRPSAWRDVVAITGVSLRRLIRDKVALFFIVLMPVVVMVIIGSTFGAAPRSVPVGVLDLDRSPVSAGFVQQLRDAGTLAAESYDTLGQLEADVRTDKIVGGIVVPAGFQGTLMAGGTTEVQIVAEPNSSTTQVVRSAVESIAEQQGGMMAAAAFASRERGGDMAANVDRAAEVAETLPRVGVQTRTVGKVVAATNNQFSYTAPSNLVLFVFINSLAAGGALVEMRRLGVAKRMLAGPMRTSTIMLGAGVSRFLIALLQSVLLLAVGGILFGVSWGSPVAVAALALVFAIVATGAGLLVGSIVKNPEQASAIGIPVAIAMGMLGGCMWPLDVVPPGLRAFGLAVTPHAWAMEAWTKLIFEGQGLGGIAGDLAVLAVWGVVLVSVGMVLFRRSLLR
ncbi:MAG: ABC transporter permease [Acidimicrobiales bacterium]